MATYLVYMQDLYLPRGRLVADDREAAVRNYCAIYGLSPRDLVALTPQEASGGHMKALQHLQDFPHLTEKVTLPDLQRLVLKLTEFLSQGEANV